MSTLTHKPNGRHIIRFNDAAGKTHWLRPGKMSRKDAQGIRVHVDAILASKSCGQPIPPDTAGWLGRVGDELHKKMVEQGLAPARAVVAGVGLKSFLDTYIARRTDLKERTLLNLKQTRTALVDFFGVKKDIREINRAEAMDWRRKLVSLGYAQPTVAMFVKKARQFFADAVDRSMIPANPFGKLKAGTQVNSARNVYVFTADVERVIAACPDAEWRLVFALARYGGLRTPSETYRLGWSNIDWAGLRMTVTSPKTEHHEGKDTRVVPIVPALLTRLKECANRVLTDKVIRSHRISNLATTGAKIVRRAGLTPWPRLFQNLRASCETDLAATFPLATVCSWIGNSQLIAARHYLSVTEVEFERATKGATIAGDVQATLGKHSGNKNAETLAIEGFPRSLYPQGESNLPSISAEKMQSVHIALQEALHGAAATVIPTGATYLHNLAAQITARAAVGGSHV